MSTDAYSAHARALDELSGPNTLWRDVQEAPGYIVSDSGTVFSLRGGHALKSHYDTDGYEVLMLNIKGKQHHRSVQRLVADAFVPGKEPGLVVKHRDRDRSNNYADNLEWCSRSESITRARRQRSHSTRKRGVVINETGERFESIAACARYLQTDSFTLHGVLAGRRKHYRGYTLSYLEVNP